MSRQVYTIFFVFVAFQPLCGPLDLSHYVFFYWLCAQAPTPKPKPKPHPRPHLLALRAGAHA